MLHSDENTFLVLWNIFHLRTCLGEDLSYSILGRPSSFNRQLLDAHGAVRRKPTCLTILADQPLRSMGDKCHSNVALIPITLPQLHQTYFIQFYFCRFKIQLERLLKTRHPSPRQGSVGNPNQTKPTK